MQNYCKTIGALAAASALVAGNASAIEIDYELSAEYTDQYIFRGLNLGKHPVAAGLTAGSEINGVGVTAGANYKSWSQPNRFGGGLVDELELSSELTYDFGAFTGGLGYIYYWFPANANIISNFAEVPISIYKSFGLVDVGLTHFYGVNSGVDFDGYTELNLSNSTELSSCLSLNTGVALGYLVEQGGLSHVTLSTSLDYALSETATFSPFIGHSWSLGERGNVYTGYQARNELFGGARIAVSF